MSILPILRFPDPVLRRPCLPVVRVDDAIRQLAADMLATMYAAPQVGMLLRLFVIDTGWREGTPTPRICINPVILDASEEVATRVEGCLSIPGVDCPVARPAEVTLQWSDETGAVITERLRGIEATCAQHELDHLNGRLCIDLLDEPLRVAASVTLAAMGDSA